MIRKLKDEEGEELTDGSVAVAERDITQLNGMQTSSDPERIKAEVFDFKALDSFKPYRDDEPLPRPQVAKNTKGKTFIKKKAEPRFYFEKDDFQKVEMGLNGKKISLFWRYKEKIPVHRKIRAYLRKRGMPGA
jgi:hypothetical protein